MPISHRHAQLTGVYPRVEEEHIALGALCAGGSANQMCASSVAKERGVRPLAQQVPVWHSIRTRCLLPVARLEEPWMRDR